MATTVVGMGVGGTVRRWSEAPTSYVETESPKYIVEYNFMRGVDKCRCFDRLCTECAQEKKRPHRVISHLFHLILATLGTGTSEVAKAIAEKNLLAFQIDIANEVAACKKVHLNKCSQASSFSLSHKWCIKE